jgi:hypothetical protein
MGLGEGIINCRGATISHVCYYLTSILVDASQVNYPKYRRGESNGYQATISRICSGNHDKRPNRQTSVGG